MATKPIITLKWNRKSGEAGIETNRVSQLHGVEKVDFLNDSIAMLTRELKDTIETFADDYEIG